MDKETLSNYGWIVICVLVLAVMLALATPFGTFVSDAVQSTTKGLFEVNQKALGAAGIEIMEQDFDEMLNGGNIGENITMLDGDGQTFNKTTDTGLTFRSSASVDTFKEVKVDSAVVNANNYTVTEGSTIITFADEYSKTLANETHTIEIVSETGTASGGFTVTENGQVTEPTEPETPPETFTFYIDYRSDYIPNEMRGIKEFTAEVGMTWRAWVESEYNINNEWELLGIGEGRGLTHGTYTMVLESTENIYIESGKTYTADDSGGAG